MTNIRKGVALTALAAGAAAVFVTAMPETVQAQGNTRMAPNFAAMDVDQDGVLSLEEFTARAKARFESLDVDGDGVLSAQEVAALGPQARQRDGARGDRGRDGRGSMGGDRQMGPGYGAFGGLLGTGPVGSGGFGDPTLTPEERAERVDQMIQMLDVDGDGKLSAAEMAGRPGPEMIFNRVDADGDGAISKEEFDAAVQTFGGGSGPRGMTR